MAEENDPGPILTGEQAKLILETWALVKQMGLEEAGIVMFMKLFEIAPQLQDLFPFKDSEVSKENEGLKNHGLQVMESIDHAIGLLKQQDLSELEDTLLDLGIIHHMKSVQVDSFAPVGQALIYTLQSCLEEKFTGEVKEAWIALYALVQKNMTQGMEEGLDI